MRSLVTGGAGFIGSAVVRALLARGDEVRVLDNFSTGKRENLTGLAGAVEILAGDLLDADALRRAVAGREAVFHLAAKVSVPQSVAMPLEDQRTNCEGTLRLLQAAAAAGVGRLVYSSSAAVYGDNPRLPLVESEAPRPLSPYGVSKCAGELYARMFSAAYGLEAVALRYFNVFGPRQDPNSPYSGVLSRFMDATRRGEPVTIFGDGRQTRDFIYVEDVARANLLAQEAPGLAGEVFNVGRGEATSLLQIAELLAQLTGTGDRAPRFEPARAGDIVHSLADIGKARQRLGFAPRWTVEAGLRAMLS
ncbi:MAG TPA: NAD-dependent epimerase/dehydratase family protein [Terriglobales bacterium]|nr:NAD-dependent epimerase/dehydratase family protein [Terriglobales bacterium]